MEGNAEAKSARQISLKQLASKNFMLSLLLFIVLVAIIVAASLRDRESMSQLASVYEDQFRVEQFKAKLSNIMLPLNDFTMTADTANFAKIKAAVKDYKASYARIESIPHLTEQDKGALAEVHSLMTGVMEIADDVASEKIPATQASQVTVLAQNLVLAAHKKLESIVAGLETQLQNYSAERESEASLQLYILLAFILMIIFLLELLNRKLLKHAQVVSRASSSVAESAGDIIEVNKLQATATDQQSRFMDKVIKGLELIADSGAKISTTTSSLEKNTDIIASFAKGGEEELDELQNNLNALAEQSSLADRNRERALRSLDQIQEVADEAHLLALNASIDGGGQEASSVTNEIQRMADQIREYADEMRSAMQENSGTDAAADQVGKSLEIARRTSEMLERIDQMSEKNSHSASVIAQATSRQNERNQKILQALQHISELLHISGNKLQAYSEASTRLSEASESLQNMS